MRVPTWRPPHIPWRPIVGTMALVTGPLMIGASPVAAASGPIVINADNPAAIPVGHTWAYNDFFPRSVEIHSGTTLQFNLLGFHTATLLAKGTSVHQDLVAAGIATADTDDTTRNVNGTKRSEFDIAGALPTSMTCGSATAPCSFDGSATVSSGAPLGPPGPFFVTVTAPAGQYLLHCRIHPQMVATIKVVGNNDHDVSTPASVARQVQKQTAAAVAAGWKAEHQANAAFVVHHNSDGSRTYVLTAGASTPDGRVAILEMLPLNVSIKAGDKVTWKNRAINEPHTVTFPEDINGGMPAFCEGTGGTDTPANPDPNGILGFSCPAGPPEFEFTGGNGVHNITSPTTVADSGLLAISGELHPFGLSTDYALSKWTATFAGAAPGTYHYVCQIHEGMEGTITVGS